MLRWCLSVCVLALVVGAGTAAAKPVFSDTGPRRPDTFKPSGLYHVAFNYPNRVELLRAVERLKSRGYTVDHATDHGGTVAVYLDDPDGDGIELSYDRPRATWFDADGRPVFKADRIPTDAI